MRRTILERTKYISNHANNGILECRILARTAILIAKQ